MNNNSNNNDDKRFEKLYELLGDEVNDIFKEQDDIFIDNNDVFIDKQNKSNSKKHHKKKKKITNSIEFVVPKPIPVNKVVNEENKKQEENEDSKEEITKVESKPIQEIEKEDTKEKPEEIKKEEDVKETFEIKIVKPQKLKEEKEEIKQEKEKIIENDTFRNKVLVSDDFILGDEEIILYNGKTIKNFFTRKFFTILLVIIFVLVCIVVFKAFYYGKKVDHYEEHFAVITSKEEEQAIMYDDKEIDVEVLKKTAATEFINCINKKVDEDKMPDSIRNIVYEINNYYNQSYDYFAFLYRDIYTGFTVSYNQNQNIFTASTIKGPTDIYIYEMASKGKVNLDEELKYTGAYYNTGSGVLKNKPLNTKYSVKTLLEYSTVHSDNAAHNMLMDKYGRINMLDFWKEKGTNAIFTNNNNWGVTNAHDASIYMQELYRFYQSDDTYGEALMKNFMNAHPKFITGKNNYAVANKSGWSGTAIHDVSIVFADNPYIVVALSNLGMTNYYMSYFNKANDLAYRLHTEYWKYKMNECNNIKQY